MKNNQHGFAHLQIVVAFILVLGVVGFAAYQVGIRNSSDQQDNKKTQAQVELEKSLEVEEQKTETVTIPAEKPAAETSTTTTPTSETPKPAPPKPAPKPVTKAPATETKKDKVYLALKSAGVSQSGATLTIASKLDKAASGKCNFKLYQEGYDKRFSSNKISGSTDCNGQLDVAGLPTYSGWSLHVWFDGDDGKTYAYQDVMPVTVTNPN